MYTRAGRHETTFSLVFNGNEIRTIPPEYASVLKWLPNEYIVSCGSVVINFDAIAALKDFGSYLFGSKANEKEDAVNVSLLAKMQL